MLRQRRWKLCNQNFSLLHLLNELSKTIIDCTNSLVFLSTPVPQNVPHTSSQAICRYKADESDESYLTNGTSTQSSLLSFFLSLLTSQIKCGNNRAPLTTIKKIFGTNKIRENNMAPRFYKNHKWWNKNVQNACVKNKTSFPRRQKQNVCFHVLSENKS